MRWLVGLEGGIALDSDWSINVLPKSSNNKIISNLISGNNILLHASGPMKMMLHSAFGFM